MENLNHPSICISCILLCYFYLIELEVADDLGYFSHLPLYLADNHYEQREEVDSTTSPESEPLNSTRKEFELPSTQQQKKMLRKMRRKQ